MTRPFARVDRHHRTRVAAAVTAVTLFAACAGSSAKTTKSSSSTAQAATTAAPVPSSTTGAPATTTATTVNAGAATTVTSAGAAASTGTYPRVGPDGDAFYTPPTPLPGATPGDLIWYRPIAVDGGKGYTILYRSTAIDGSSVAVSGTVIVPSAPSATENRSILAWAHGTTGLGDSCATSRRFATGNPDEATLVDFVVQAGLLFVATDYQGLGTPGDHAYVMNLAEGRNVLDSVRAALQLPGTGATGASKTVIWGHSQGGGAAALAAELKPTYAPELNIAGAMAGAPAGDLEGVGAALDGNGFFGYMMMATVGLAAAYPKIDVKAKLTPAGAQIFDQIRTQCSTDIIKTLAGKTAADYLVPGLATDPAVTAALKENSAGYLKTDVPIFLYQGDADEQVPVAVSKTMFDRYCAIGNVVERKVYPGQDHVGVIFAAVTDLATWLNDRLNGQPATSTCSA